LQFTCHLLHISPQDRRQISVHHRGVAAADQLDQRRDLVADRDLRKAHVAGEFRHLLLMLGVTVGVHEDDRDRVDAVGLRGGKRAACALKVKTAFHRAVGADAFVDFRDALIKHVGLDDVAGENLRPRLIADLQRVAETFRDEEECTVALALQQRVGRDRSAHLHGADPARRDGIAALKAKKIADALHGGVGIGLRVFRQQLVRGERTIRCAADNVGEGAAAIDPEIPAAGAGCCRAARCGAA
jgi:hypothetical protein